MPESWRESLDQFPWIIDVLEMAGLIVAAWAIRKVSIAWMRRMVQKRRIPRAQHFVALFNRALIPILALGVLDAAINIETLPPKLMAVCNRVLYLSVLIAGIYYGAKALRLLIEHWLAKKSSRASIREPTLFLTRVLFAAFGIMIVLDNLGISLTAVWTTLGIGSVAVALALQDTLSNFFAGVYIHLDSPVRVGDYIKIDAKDEGYVTAIGWRSARIQTLGNSTVVVPNSKLASTVVVNYSMPDTRMSVNVPVSVSYDMDPDRVEHILADEAERALTELPGAVTDAKPGVHFIPGFGESSMTFTVGCQVNTYVDQYQAQDFLRKRIYQRFRKEGINFPVPQRDVRLFVKDWPAAAPAPHNGGPALTGAEAERSRQ